MTVTKTEEMEPVFHFLLFLAVADIIYAARTCYNCKGIPEPHDCEKFIECLDGEQCYADFYITEEYHVFYDLGCQAGQVCNAIKNYGRKRDVQRREDTDNRVHLCEQCCDTDGCNRLSCGDKYNYPNRTMCYSCPDVLTVDDCEKVELCNEGHICYATKVITANYDERWTVGCKRPDDCNMMKTQGAASGHPINIQPVGKRRAPVSERQLGIFPYPECHYCCSTDRCNHVDCVLDATTTKSTTHSSTTHKHVTTKPATHQPTTHKPTTHKPTTTESTTHSSTTHKHVTTKPTTHKPATHKPHTTESTTHSSTTHKHVTTKPTTHKPATHKPATHKPATHKPTTTESTTHSSTTHKHVTTKPTTHKPATHKPATHKPATHKPHTTESTTHSSTTHKHVTTKPTTHKPATHKPATHKPTTTTSTTHATTKAPHNLNCFYCDYVNHENQCNHTTICNAGEVCYLSRVDGDFFSNQCFFIMGCQPKNTCKHMQDSIKSHRGSVTTVEGDTVDFVDCCDTDRCNDHHVSSRPSLCVAATDIPNNNG